MLSRMQPILPALGTLGRSSHGLGRAKLTAAAAAALDTRWREVVALETGAASYEDLYEQVNGRPFPLPRALGC